MQTSVLVIAHNEEAHIRQCLESLGRQTVLPDEIVLIAHNCTDATVQIASQFTNVKTIGYSGPAGIASARIEGLSHVAGDIVLCIDGDSYAEDNWIEEMSKALKKNKNTMVGSWVRQRGNVWNTLANPFHKYLCVSKGTQATKWLWGASFGFWGKDMELVKKYLNTSMALSEKLGLSRNPDDYWLALFMSRHGDIEIINKTHVTQNTKEPRATNAIYRTIENNQNGHKIRDYFNKSSK
jgi:glycosyltransferase involved in cell wall biosynthesis